MSSPPYAGKTVFQPFLNYLTFSKIRVYAFKLLRYAKKGNTV